jgi:hypothetical protein
MAWSLTSFTLYKALEAAENYLINKANKHNIKKFDNGHYSFNGYTYRIQAMTIQEGASV